VLHATLKVYQFELIKRIFFADFYVGGGARPNFGQGGTSILNHFVQAYDVGIFNRFE
jgi:hypothetical protein